MKECNLGKSPMAENTLMIDKEPASPRDTISKTNKKNTSWEGVRFKCKKLQKMYEYEQGTHKYPEAVVENFFEKMQLLCMASNKHDLYNIKSLGFHKLKKGKLKGKYAVWLTGNWRLTMTIEDDIETSYLEILEIVDYHP